MTHFMLFWLKNKYSPEAQELRGCILLDFFQNCIDNLILFFAGNIGRKWQGQHPAAKIGADGTVADLLIVDGCKGRLLVHPAGIVDHGGDLLPLQNGHDPAAFIGVSQQDGILRPCGGISLGNDRRAHFIPETVGIVNGGCFNVVKLKALESLQLDLQDGGLQSVQPGIAPQTHVVVLFRAFAMNGQRMDQRG